MYVCLCLGVTDREIRETIAEGASSADEVMHCTGAGSRCGSCRATVAAMVAAVDEERPSGRCRLVRLPVTSAA